MLNYFNEIDNLVEENRLVEILSDLVNCRSDTEGDMEYSISIYLKEFLEKIGAEVEMQHVELKRYNVVARFKGKHKGKTFMYCGHTDVVPPGNENNWKRPPFTAHIENGKMFGRGTSDMKGSIASILHAMEILKKLNIDFCGDILLVFDVDEEISNKGLYKFFESGIKADACLIGEPSNMVPTLGHKGIIGFWLNFKGKKAHASKPDLGINPIMHAMSFSQKVENFDKDVLVYRTSPMGPSTMAITYISAGKELNSIPQECDVRVDRRLILGETKESSCKELELILQELKKEIKDFDCEYRVTTFCPPCEIPEDDYFVKDLKFAINLANPSSVPITYMAGTCEASLISERMKIPVVICGPGDIGLAHIENEFIEIEQLSLGTKIFAKFILKFLNQ